MKSLSKFFNHIFNNGDILKKELLSLIKEHAINNKLVTLASCRKSLVYVDIEMVATLPEGASLIADLIVNKIHGGLDTIGGPIMGAVPILGALSGRGYYRTFFVRAEPKKHGLTKQIEGQINDNDREIAIIDDVATSGRSLLTTINTVKHYYPYANINKVIVVVDREEGATKRLAKHGYTLESIFKLKDIV